jgi:hypothetical protein
MHRLTCLAVLAALLLGGSAAARAQITAEPAAFEVTFGQREEHQRTVRVRNTSSETLTLCLDFADPLQQGVTSTPIRGHDCGVPGDSLFGISGPVVGSPFSMTMLPDGRVLTADSGSPGRTREFTPDLQWVRTFNHPRTQWGTTTTGIAYDANNNTLWWLDDKWSGFNVEYGRLLEGTMDGEATGRSIELPMVPVWPTYPGDYGTHVGLIYDSHRGLFYYMDGINEKLWAIDTLGQVPEGYPRPLTDYDVGQGPGMQNADMDGHGGTAGMRIEIPNGPWGTTATRATLTDRWGRNLGPETPMLPLEYGKYGVVRSRLEPNAILYFQYVYFNQIKGIRAVRPVPLSPPWLDLEAWTITLAPGEEREVPLLFNIRDAEVGSYSDRLLFRQPDHQVLLEVPIQLDVTLWTSTEPVPAESRQSMSVYPNPTRASAEVMLELASPAHLVAEVFDVLGRRVRVLADGMRQPGRHVLAVEGLSPGVYVVRAVVGGEVVTRRMTVL